MKSQNLRTDEREVAYIENNPNTSKNTMGLEKYEMFLTDVGLSVVSLTGKVDAPDLSIPVVMFRRSVEASATCIHCRCGRE